MVASSNVACDGLRQSHVSLPDFSLHLKIDRKLRLEYVVVEKAGMLYAGTVVANLEDTSISYM